MSGLERELRMEGPGLDAAGRLGDAGCVAIIELDPFEKRLARCGGDGSAVTAGHDQPLVPTARRYSVTWTPPVTPTSTVSALRIAG